MSQLKVYLLQHLREVPVVDGPAVVEAEKKPRGALNIGSTGKEAVRRTVKRPTTLSQPPDVSYGPRVIPVVLSLSSASFAPARQLKASDMNNPFQHPTVDIPKPRATEDDQPLSWQRDAICSQTDPEAFFPEKGGSTRDAKKICNGCEVRDQCLQYALDNDERFGIWGGLSERERRKLKRRAA